MDTQVAIVGGGPGGSACAIHLARLGITSTIVEREQFPRFHIGESLTEQSGSCLRELGFNEDELSARYPIKHGVSIYGPAGRNPFWIPVMRRDSSGEFQKTFTWQVRRSEFDKMLLDRAQDVGVQVFQGQAKAPLFDDGGSIRGLSVSTPAGNVELGCDVLVDASGQRTFLANARVTGPKLDGRYCRQIAVFAHVKGAVLTADQWGNTLIYFRHIYHWAWFIPLDAEVTSIGFVIPADYFRSRSEPLEVFFRRELQEFNRELATRIRDVTIIDHVRAISNYSHHIDRFSGKGWLCIGDAHKFIDPLFSFGVSTALSEAREVAPAICRYVHGERTNDDRPFLAFEKASDRATRACQTVVDAFWESTLSFGILLTRYRDDIIDLLAGHVWDGRRYAALDALEAALAASRSQARADALPAET